MLKKVLFYIDKKNKEDSEIVANVNEAAKYVKSCGFEAVVKIAGGVSDEKKSHDDSGSSGESALDESLFLTDSGLAARLLTETGAYVVGISHKLNEGEDFGGLKYIFTDIQEVDIDSYIKAYQRYAHLPWEVIITPRLLIRETTIEDVDRFYELYSDPEMTRYMEGLFENPEDEKRYQKDYIDKVYGLLGFGIWTVVKRDDNTVIGRAGYSVRNGFDDIELGFLIGKDYQGQGYAFEACDAILKYGKEILLFDKVQTLVKEENTVSIGLCKKLGFAELDTVEVEENIYGDEYNTIKTGTGKAPGKGRYKRMIRQL